MKQKLALSLAVRVAEVAAMVANSMATEVTAHWNKPVVPVGHSNFNKNLAAMRLRKNRETLAKNNAKRMARFYK